MKYRADIDGLRAVAVLPIVLFHAGVAAMPGGFTGVDIFFVISGYLITSIIQGEMRDGSFSLLTFYRRRVVRIVPALIVMLAVVLVAGCALLLPGELRDLGRSAAATAAFGSNIYFWKTANYFAGSAESKALLHTWSLGVEEQFYIFYPLLLMAVRRVAAQHLKPVLAMVVGASFLLGVVVELAVPGGAGNFYLLPARAWELGLGGLVALGAFPSFARTQWRAAGAVTGLAMIAVGLFVIGPESPFPIPWAALPAIGTALVLAYGADLAATNLLASWPMVQTGRISYSLYLWHWPIIVFYRIETGAQLDWKATSGLVIASFAAAIASRALIERPMLDRYREGKSVPIVAGGVLVLAAVVGCSLLVASGRVKLRRLPVEAERVAAYGDYADSAAWRYQYRRGPCFAGEGGTYDVAACLRPASDRANILVLGDSHAAQYWRAIALARPDANVLQATASGCRPVLPLRGMQRCTDMVAYALGPFLDHAPLDTVVLGGRWRMADIEGAKGAVARLRAAGIRVVVIGPTVEYHGDFSQLLARAMISGDFASLVRLRATEQQPIDRALSAAVRSAGARYVSAYDIECPADRCRYQAPGGAPMQFDYGHLTLDGARYVIGEAGL